MKRFVSKLLASVVLMIAAVTGARAGVVFVGSWSVADPSAPLFNDGPDTNGPLAYTAQEAAALLFGGVASDYSISTAGDQVADINHLGWYDVLGWGGAAFAEDYNKKYLGAYYGPFDYYIPSNPTALEDSPASAFIRDWLQFEDPANYVNYAFRVTPDAVPDSGATGALLALGLAGFVTMRRKIAT